MGLSITQLNVQKAIQTAVFAYDITDLSSAVEYLGGDTFLDGLSQDQGAINPFYVKRTDAIGYAIAGFTQDPQALGETTVNQYVLNDAAEFLRDLKNKNCPVMLLNANDICGRPDDLESWNNVHAAVALRLTNLDFADIGSRDTDATSVVTGTISFLVEDKILPLLFAERADASVLAEVLRVKISDSVNCGNCGVSSNGCQVAFALTKANAGSPGLSSQLLYTKDLFADDVNIADIPTLGGLSASDMDVVGKYVVVVSEASGSHHYAPKSAPVASSWIEVTNGYVAGASPRAIFSQSARATFIAAAGGYIYKATNITTEVETVADNSLSTNNLNDIHGKGQVIVAVGDSNTVYYSINRGKSFGAIVGPTVGVNLQAVYVVDNYKWYVGTGDGRLYYTQDQGATWTQRVLPNQSAIEVIWGIDFEPASVDQFGAIAVELASGGAVYRTVTGGREWYTDSPGIAELPANDRIRSVSVCGGNTIMAGGLADGTTDGILAVALA